MIIPPWLFFAMHMVQGYSLATAWGNWYGRTAKYVAYLWHIWVATSEHFTLAFPFLDHFAYKFNFFAIAGLEFITLVYIAYCNPGANDPAGNKQKLAAWLVLIFIMSGFLTWLELGAPPIELLYERFGLGPPVPLTPESMLKLFETGYYNAGHFLGHFVFTMSWAAIQTHTQFDPKPNLGFVPELLRQRLVRIGTQVKEKQAIFKFGWCIVVLALALVISNWDSVNIISGVDAPFLPPLCMTMVKADDECSLLGITVPCHNPWSSDAIEYFGFGMSVNHIWTFFVTFIIGAIYLCITPCQRFCYDTIRGYSLHITCALYAMETSFFALFRYYFGISLPLVLAAALHNLFEWSILFHVSDFHVPSGSTPDKMLIRWLLRALIFICAVVTICMSIPNLFYSLVFEQLFGIVLDFALPMIFVVQASKDETFREMFWKPAAAHTIHIFGTILPLVFSIFLSGAASWLVNFWMEIAITVSVPVTHLLYCSWAFDLANKDKLEAQRRAAEAPDLVTSNGPSNQLTKEVTPESGLLEDKYRIKNARPFLIGGFMLGVIALGIFPRTVLPECETSGCASLSYVAKTHTLHAHEVKTSEFPLPRRSVQQMLKSYPGLLDITVGHALSAVAGTGFVMVEYWGAIEDVNEELFDALAKTSAKTTNEKFSRTTYAPSSIDTSFCPAEIIGHISHNITSHSCSSVWNVLESPDFCAWVPGCVLMERENMMRSKAYLDDGSIVDAFVKRDKKNLEIEVSTLFKSRAGAYHSEISLVQVGRSACTVNYHYRRNYQDGSKMKAEYYFTQYFVPEIDRVLKK